MKTKDILRKAIVRIFIVGCFIVLSAAPVAMMYRLSQSEKEAYIQDKSYNYKEASYGAAVMVDRKDIEQYVTVSGRMESADFEYINLNSQEGKIRIYTEIGDEIMTGDTIANVDGKDIKSTINGIVYDIDLSDGGYIKVGSIDKLQMVSLLDKRAADKIRNIKELKLEDGRKVTVKRISNILTDGYVSAVFVIENSEYMYGEQISDLKLYTGKTYTDLLVVDKRAVYKKTDGNYYVRVIDHNDYYVTETQVQINYESDDVIGITGVEEGTLCDSGYKNLIESSNAGFEE